MREESPTTESRTGSDDPAGLEDDVDTIFDVLSDEYRRWILHHVAACPGKIGLNELVGRIRTREDSPGNDPVENSDKQIRIRLYHCHLPKLETARLVKFDRARGTVQAMEGRRLDACLNLLACVNR